jgi:Domain of unknown function (DUF4157)
MESHFGHDFSSVRIHDDPKGASAADSISARAFTHGTDIAFGQGEYAPQTPSGLRLLTHELVHVMQQRARAVTGLLARSPHPFPWRGEISASWNAALRSRPHKDSAHPYEGILADLDKGTQVTVTGEEHGWLHLEATVDGKKLTGYVSQELVRFVGPVEQPSTWDLSQPIDLGVRDPDNAFVALKRAENRRLAFNDWTPSAAERKELETAADTLEQGGKYTVDRSTFAVSFAGPSTGSKVSVTTIEDFILFVEAVEQQYPWATPGEVAGEIRQIQYAGGNWEALLDSPGITDRGHPVDLEGGRRDPHNPIAQRFDVPAVKIAGHKLATAFGDIDVFHVVAGIDAAINGAAKKPASDDNADQLKFRALTAADTGDPRDFVTWSGDLGQAYADYLWARYGDAKKDHKLRAYIDQVITPEQQLGDIHGYIASQVFASTPPNAGTGWYLTGQSPTVSNVLRTLYLVDKHGTGGAGTYQSFVEQVSGKSGADLKQFAFDRALAFARIWYVKDARDELGNFGAAKRAGDSSASGAFEKLTEEFDASHADNERTALPEDRLSEVVARFMAALGGTTG